MAEQDFVFSDRRTGAPAFKPETLLEVFVTV